MSYRSVSLCILVRSGQVLLGAEFAVDTFFTIGGFIACYMLTQHLIKKLRPPAGEECSSADISAVCDGTDSIAFHSQNVFYLMRLFGFWQVVRARRWAWLGSLCCTSSAGCASLPPTSLSCASTGKS